MRQRWLGYEQLSTAPSSHQLTRHSQQEDHKAARSREPSPNRGASVPDVTAIGEEQESLQSWRQRVGIDPSKQIRLVKVSHMRYQHPDLAEITKFLRGTSET